MPPQDYELLDVIGDGTSGQVHRGYDCQRKLDVAVKKLHLNVLSNDHLAQQAFDEARFIADLLEVQNVVRVLEVIEEQGLVVMELMKASFDRVVTKKAVRPAQVCEILTLSLCGLRAMHESGRLHGAIRPSSLLFDEKGKMVKLTASARITPGSKEIPVPHPRHVKYLAPELIDPSFGAIGPGTDLYCLGFTALELLKGPGFNDIFKATEIEAEAAWLRLHGSAGEAMPKCKDVAPATPDGLATVIDRLLCRNVAERYADSQEVLDDLASVRGRPVTPAPTEAPAPPPPPPQKTPPPRPIVGRIVIQGKAGQLLGRFPIREGDNFIGKPEDEWSYIPEVNLEKLDTKEVISRKHAMLRVDGDRMTLVDLSMNGTWLDNAKMPRKKAVEITPESRLRFANLFAQVELDRAAPPLDFTIEDDERAPSLPVETIQDI